MCLFRLVWGLSYQMKRVKSQDSLYSRAERLWQSQVRYLPTSFQKALPDVMDTSMLAVLQDAEVDFLTSPSMLRGTQGDSGQLSRLQARFCTAQTVCYTFSEPSKQCCKAVELAADRR